MKMTTAATKTRRRAASGEGRRRRHAAAQRQHSAEVADIGRLPRVKNPKRREACRLDLLAFLVTYFPNSTGLSPFSDDHRKVIARIQHCILRGGRFLNVVYRGFAKTSISEGSALWATLYGHRKFVPILGADAPAAAGIVDSLKLELSDNDLLHEDFPEVCHPIRALEGKPQRCGSQSYKGERTHIGWRSDRIILPTIPRSVASGAILCSKGISAGLRGMKFKRPDGRQQRPDFVIGDDLQTDEVAASVVQVGKVLGTLRKAVLKLGGHQRQLAVVLNATIIEPGDVIDQLSSPDKNPSWDGLRIAMVKQWATAHESLWLGQYATLRNTYDKAIEGDQRRAHQAATEFYRQHRAEMDAGCIVSWSYCYDSETELSAVQHAYNALIDDGEEAFQSEYQNAPLPRVKTQFTELTADQVAARLNHHVQALVPAGCTRLTAFADVQQGLLYFCVCAWQQDFGGAVVDYGAWPRQARAYFTLRDARPTLASLFPAMAMEAQLHAGLTALTGELLSRDWLVDGGGTLRIERMLIDAGWQSEVVERFCRSSPHAAVLQPSKGRGIGASANPISSWQIKSGEVRGYQWIQPAVKPGHGQRLVIFDSNEWKSFTAARLGAPLGGKGCLTLFGATAETHRLFAEHCTSEYRVRTAGRGRVVDEWRLHTGRENHLWDALTGCCVAASTLGITLAELAPPPKPERKRVRFSEWQAQAQARRGAG